MDSPKRIICILGMHRSGTSCLTGSLQEAGLHLGECHTWNPYNLKGNRESQDFVDLHDDILKANGGSWDNPPKGVIWSLEHKQRARELLANFSGAEVMGFKDPRTLLVLDGWKEITDRFELVGIFRHPEAVVNSLRHRNQKTRAESLSLWFTYNQCLLREYKRRSFPLICFDDTQEVFQAKLRDLVKQLGFGNSCNQQQFYDDELKTCGANLTPRLPWRVGRLYGQLQKCTI